VEGRLFCGGLTDGRVEGLEVGGFTEGRSTDGRCVGRVLGLGVGRAAGLGVGRATGLGAGRELGRLILEPVIGLRWVLRLMFRLGALRLLLRLGVFRLLLRLGMLRLLLLPADAREPPPRASRASSSGAMNANPIRMVRNVEKIFMGL